MKKLLPSLLLFSLIVLSFSACKKAPVYETITKNLKVNESYEYNLGGFDDEEGAGISKQAQHFSISEIDYTQINSSVISYKYKPALNFEGVDEVQLKSSRGSDGSNWRQVKFHYYDIVVSYFFYFSIFIATIFR